MARIIRVLLQAKYAIRHSLVRDTLTSGPYSGIVLTQRSLVCLTLLCRGAHTVRVRTPWISPAIQIPQALEALAWALAWALAKPGPGIDLYMGTRPP